MLYLLDREERAWMQIALRLLYTLDLKSIQEGYCLDLCGMSKIGYL